MHLSFAHALWKELVKPGDLVIDATCGNGHDTLFVSTLGAEVIGCDIQIDAIEATRQRLQVEAELHLTCHTKLINILGDRRPKLVLFNLGYLPGSGNKERTTLATTTLKAVTSLMKPLLPGGALSITCYPGHPEGAREEQLLLEWATSLPYPSWSAAHHRWLRHDKAPSLLFIQKSTIK